jgi:hypothetical protein
LITWIAFEPTFKAIYATWSVDIICSRDGTQWCYLEFQQALVNLEGATPDQLIQRAPLFCKPCTFKFLFKWKSLIEYANANLNNALAEELKNVTNVVLYMGWLCVKDRAGVYCNAKITGYDFTAVEVACGGAGTAGPNGEPVCPANCKTQIQRVISDLGCCLDTWLDLMYWQNCFNTPCADAQNPALIRFMITNICKLDLPLACQRHLTLEAIIQVENLRWPWCQLHMPRCLELVRTAVALQFYLDVADLREKILATHLSAAAPIGAPNRRLLQTNEMEVQVKFGDVFNRVGSVDANRREETIVVAGTPGDAKPTLDAPTQTRVLSATVGSSAAAGLVPSISFALLAFLLLFV